MRAHMISKRNTFLLDKNWQESLITCAFRDILDFFWPNLGKKKTNLALKWQIFERNCKNMLICIFLHSFYTNFNHIKVLSTLNLQNSMFSIFWHFLTRSKSSPKKGSMQSMYENMLSNLPGHINFWTFAEKSKKKALFYRKIS